MADWGKVKNRGNVEDRRGQRTGIALGGGLTGIVLVAAFVFLTGGSMNDALQAVLQQVSQKTVVEQRDQPFEDPANYQAFAGSVLGSTNEVWNRVFEQQNQTYLEPTLVLFRDAIRTGCGAASSAVGPFYCPADQTIYLDETFFDALRHQLDTAAGKEDVAQAYVIAHEAGHHVQNLTGVMDRYGSAAQSDPSISTKIELQADCYAGIWAHSAAEQGIFENDAEIEEALDLASAIGDDKVQEKTTGQVNPETWTHGSSKERVQWFKTGYSSGDIEACDTF